MKPFISQLEPSVCECTADMEAEMEAEAARAELEAATAGDA